MERMISDNWLSPESTQEYFITIKLNLWKPKASGRHISLLKLRQKILQRHERLQILRPQLHADASREELSKLLLRFSIPYKLEDTTPYYHCLLISESFILNANKNSVHISIVSTCYLFTYIKEIV